MNTEADKRYQRAIERVNAANEALANAQTEAIAARRELWEAERQSSWYLALNTKVIDR